MSAPKLPLIIQAEALQELLPCEEFLLIAVCSPDVFAKTHIAGSQLIEPAELVCGIKPGTGKIPDAEQLSRVFSRVGLNSDKHVIAYDDEGGGWAGRLIWTLDVLGHKAASYLDGGLVAWTQAGYPVSDKPVTVAPSHYSATIDHSQIASMEDILAQIDATDSKVWDARAAEEYAGNKITANRNGHIPGAVNLDWLDLMDRDNGLRLRPLPDIAAQLQSLGIDQSQQVFTHCQTHHRSGLSYLVGRALGLKIKAYDGSWSEWGNHPDTPITTGVDP